MYEHVKESELEAGHSKREAKSIPAATVLKHRNEKGHPRSK